MKLSESNHSSEDEDKEYEVEEIMSERTIKRRNKKSNHEFLIKWKGYDEPTWEPENYLVNCGDALKKFYMKKNSVINEATNHNIKIPFLKSKTHRNKSTKEAKMKNISDYHTNEERKISVNRKSGESINKTKIFRRRNRKVKKTDLCKKKKTENKGKMAINISNSKFNKQSNDKNIEIKDNGEEDESSIVFLDEIKIDDKNEEKKSQESELVNKKERFKEKNNNQIGKKIEIAESVSCQSQNKSCAQPVSNNNQKYDRSRFTHRAQVSPKSSKKASQSKKSQNIKSNNSKINDNPKEKTKEKPLEIIKQKGNTQELSRSVLLQLEKSISYGSNNIIFDNEDKKKEQKENQNEKNISQTELKRPNFTSKEINFNNESQRLSELNKIESTDDNDNENINPEINESNKINIEEKEKKENKDEKEEIDEISLDDIGRVEGGIDILEIYNATFKKDKCLINLKFQKDGKIDIQEFDTHDPRLSKDDIIRYYEKIIFGPEKPQTMISLNYKLNK